MFNKWLDVNLFSWLCAILKVCNLKYQISISIRPHLHLQPPLNHVPPLFFFGLHKFSFSECQNHVSGRYVSAGR